jgi:hypothetical protein
VTAQGVFESWFLGSVGLVAGLSTRSTLASIRKEFSEDDQGRIVADVHQVVRALDGAVTAATDH